MTLGDKYRNMSDEELAELISGLVRDIFKYHVINTTVNIEGYKKELIKQFGSELTDDTN